MLLKGLPSSQYIREYFHHYASVTHLAGSANDQAQAVWTRDKFIEFGIEDTQIETYYPLMNYPIKRRLAIVDGPQELLYEAKLQETPVAEDATQRDGRIPTFHAYSADGNVTGHVVYVHYGRLEDFNFLSSQGLNFTDTIALIRNGMVSRGLKIRAAEMFGCSGVLLYSDPSDDGPANKETDDGVPALAYPNGPWRSASSVERGTVHYLSVYPGDPLTPGYAATENATRLEMEQARALPRIPSLPISWSDAKPLLKATETFGLRSEQSGWQGGLVGVNYYSGPSEAKVNMVNLNEYKIAPIWNVVGRIQGSEEPNRAIIIGNHRDAWGYGAADPSSGSAVMLELVRVLGIMLEQGWQPRRTIIVASWDAEEFGTVGSTEWVEDHKDWLSEEAVAYINVDTAVTGPNFDAQSSPLLMQLLYEITDEVIDPHTSKTVFEAWKARHQKETAGKGMEPDELAFPMAKPLGAGSDFVAFQDHVGISSLNLKFKGDYGVSHSNYDSIYWMENFGDPTFEYHRTMVRIWGLLVMRLSTDWLLPMHPLDYSNEIARYSAHISNLQGCLALPELSAAVAALQDRCIKLEKKLRKYQHKIDKGKHNKKLRKHVRKSNEHLTQMERAFIDPQGLPGREWYRHIIYAPAMWNGYDVQVFPAIHEAMHMKNPATIREMEERAAVVVNNALNVLNGHYDDFVEEEDDADLD
ncbi:hypothetical protein BDB00DRAFT_762385 [Zychaea mexicana]|uniref:uncharacterized protein n=1 Tax=Zychaea mexicana TaxID=64656 RepID=UPI0022FE5F64|nr:uncharacterized protein BDB00DRAFT_762385 [Zychaea mexicana]KAI9494175.1 hypothetical protein BDB00DRAFT_762385 [Zychaea mexicana]